MGAVCVFVYDRKELPSVRPLAENFSKPVHFAKGGQQNGIYKSIYCSQK